MRKIRVLEFNNQWELGGTDKNSQTFMMNYDKDKFDVLAAGWRGGKRLQTIIDLGIEIFITGDKQAMVDWMKSKNIDIIHFYRGGETDHLLIDTVTEAGIPILIEHNCFGSFDSSDDRHKINKHVVCSKTSVEVYKKRSGNNYEPDKVTYVYCPTETDKIGRFCEGRDYSPPIFGRYSRADSLKWSLLNLQILPIVRAAVPDAKFHAMGIPQEYKDAIKRMGVEDMVVDLGSPVDDTEVLKLLKTITVFTHAARVGESFGNTIAESMSAGLPVITHTGGDSAQCELVTDDYNGYIVEPNDYKTYAAKLIELLLNPDLKKKLGQNGKNRAKEWFDVGPVTRELEAIYLSEFNKYQETAKQL